MSKVKISGNASGTGVLTIEAPNTNTDRTITLPDVAGEILTDGQALPAIDGSALTGLPAAGADTSLSNLSATGEQRVCQAWVNFNGTGTVAIRDSHNVSSITDVNVGNYRVNFSNAMANTNYSVSTGGGNGEFAGNRVCNSNATSTAYCSLVYYSGGTQDVSNCYAQVFGD